jgi:hypothetical protein
MTWRAVIPLVALAAVGCTWGGEASELRLTQVIPGASTRGVTLNVTLVGEGFSPSVVVDFDDPSSSSVCDGLRVELRAAGQPAPIPLERARLVSPTELRAHLRGDAYSSAWKGAWDVVVVGPDGTEAVLPKAFGIDLCDSSPPSAPCDDGEDDCTTTDVCTGNSHCGGTPVADATPCTFPCTDGARVAGACQAGACVPAAGLCESPPACTR